MAAPQLEGDVLDRLDLGSGEPGDSRRVWWRAAALLTVGGLIGWGAAHTVNTVDPPAAATGGGVRLVAGSFQQDLTRPFASDYLVTLSNVGGSPAKVLGVAPHGWLSSSPPTQLLPGASVDVPIDVSLDCHSTPPPSAMVDVRLADGRTSRLLELPMAEVPPALLEVYERRCGTQSLRHPSETQLLGTWVVEEGGAAFTGRMLMRFTRDGRYAMDAGTRLAHDPGAAGRFRLNRHGRLALRTLTGGSCGAGSTAVWRVGLQADGRLHIRQLTAYDGFCTVEPGDVWIAKRVAG